MANLAKIIIVDAGPLAAAASPGEAANHAWAVKALGAPRGRFVTFESALAEAQHATGNDARAIARLRAYVSKMDVVPVATRKENREKLYDKITRHAPRMDFADACAVALQEEMPNSFVLTLDHEDFSAYRVPFGSPKGMFYA